MQIYSIIKIQGNVVALAPVMNNDAENKIAQIKYKKANIWVIHLQ